MLVSCGGTSPSPFARVDQALTSAVERGAVQGVVAMAATRQGIIYQGAFGEGMTIDSAFQIASMTKAVTAVAAMQLVERGLLTLDTPAADYLPTLAAVQVLDGFDPDTGEPVYRPPASAVTVRQLLSHSSGFAYELWNPDILRLVEEERLPSLFAAKEGILNAPLIADPATVWSYGVSTDWVGDVVEAISGQPLRVYFETNVFAPLKMVDTYFPEPGSTAQPIAPLFARQADGTLLEQPPFVSIPYTSGGAGLVSTAPDYLRFTRALLGDGAFDGVRILNANTAASMAENHIGDLEAGAMRSVMPEFTNDFDFFPGSVDKMGLGFLLNATPVAGGRAAGSMAWAGLFNTYFWIDRKRGVCAVLMTQVLPFYDEQVIELLDAYERGIYALVD
jgi:CubicO group peptidase (beta-lactamase class C family)